MTRIGHHTQTDSQLYQLFMRLLWIDSPIFYGTVEGTTAKASGSCITLLGHLLKSRKLQRHGPFQLLAA